MHHSKLSLTARFWAAYLMATHSNGISALQLQRQLGFRSYKTAWLLCAKLQRSMLAPGRSPLAGLVKVDETEIVLPQQKRSDHRWRRAHPPQRSRRLFGRPPSSGRLGSEKTKSFIYECAACGRQTSVTAGPIMPASCR
jgi:hypothetical protein